MYIVFCFHYEGQDNTRIMRKVVMSYMCEGERTDVGMACQIADRWHNGNLLRVDIYVRNEISDTEARLLCTPKTMGQFAKSSAEMVRKDAWR